MRWYRLLLNVVLLLATMVVETVWLSPLGLPGSVPPLVLVSALSISRLRSVQNAALLGFGVGICMDMVPPAVNVLGITAFAYTLAAFMFSYWRKLMDGSTLLTYAGVAIAAETVVIVRTVLELLLGSPVAGASSLLLNLVTSPLYAVMLASIIMPVTLWLNGLASSPRAQNVFTRL